MTKRESERKELWKNLLSALAVATVIVAIALVAGFSWRERYDEDYFVSDDTKLVIAMDSEIASFEDGEFEPETTYVVYYYTGDTVRGMQVFYAYDSNEEAKLANENITVDGKDWAVSKSLNGKYIIFSVTSDQYENLSATSVKNIIESMRAAGTLRE